MYGGAGARRELSVIDIDLSSRRIGGRNTNLLSDSQPARKAIHPSIPP